MGPPERVGEEEIGRDQNVGAADVRDRITHSINLAGQES